VELLAQYGLFLAKIATVVVAIAVIAIIVNLTQRKKQRGELRVTNLSEQYKEMKEELAVALLDGRSRSCGIKRKRKSTSRRQRRQRRGRSSAHRAGRQTARLGAGF
jgi:serine protease SohB